MHNNDQMQFLDWKIWNQAIRLNYFIISIKFKVFFHLKEYLQMNEDIRV